MISRLRTNKKILALILVVLVGSFFFASSAAATNWAATVVGWIAVAIVFALGKILILLMKVLIWVAQYNTFIQSGAVTNGWVIVRDLCNMFFVVILLVIAFATILHIENYSYKKWLPKLLMMAVLINFSKTICGLLIDFAQIIMLTFVNAFKDIGGGNLVDMLGIADWNTIGADGNQDISNWDVVGASILAVFYVIISVVVIATMIAMLVMRIVMIWVYVVLSPLAYLLAAFPGGQSYASKWWSEFIKNLIVGPVLAFFIWLSFVTIVPGSTGSSLMGGVDTSNSGSDFATSSAELPGEMKAAGTSDLMLKFIISIGMLLGGLKISQEIGGAAGGMAGKGMARINKMGVLAAGGAAAAAGFLVKRPASYGIDKLHEKTGVDLNVKRVWKGVQEKRKENAEKRYTTGQLEAQRAMESGGRVRGVLAMTGNPGDAWDQLTSWKGVKQRLKGGKVMRRMKDSAIEDLESNKLETEKQEFFRGFADIDVADVAARQQKVVATGQELNQAQFAVQAEEAKGDDADQNILEKLKYKEQIAAEKHQYVQDNFAKDYTDEDKSKIDSNIAESRDQRKRTEDKIERNTPMYNFEARAAEQHAVSHEASKIKDITDVTELMRILKDAIKDKDKTMAKAIMLKMSREANDNEFLKPFTGRTDHKGLKDLMRQLSDKDSENYGGFDEQESFALGSQIAEINKSTNHWGATSAYTMENGRWRETTDKEHNEIRNAETGKQQLQALIRNNNRLAYGYHDETGKFNLDAGGVMMLKRIDSAAGHKNIETMNESAAKHVLGAITANTKLTAMFSVVNPESKKSLIDAITSRLGNVSSSDFETNYNDVTTNLGFS